VPGRQEAAQIGNGLGRRLRDQIVNRLDRAVEMRRAATPPMEGDMVPKAAVAALASRLDETIARLRSNLDEAV